MTEPNTAPGTTPGVTPSSAQNPNPPASTPAPTAPPIGEPDWLNQRIAQAKSSAAADAIKSLGFKDAEEAKQIAADYAKRVDAEKSAETRAAELKSKLDVETAAKDNALSVAREHAGRMMIGLSAEQQAAVKQLAGDDPVKMLATIGALVPTWAKQAAESAAAAAATQPMTTTNQPLASTSPPPSAPNGNPPNAAPTPRAQYEALRSVNPFAAAFFGGNNPEAYKK